MMCVVRVYVIAFVSDGICVRLVVCGMFVVVCGCVVVSCACVAIALCDCVV